MYTCMLASVINSEIIGRATLISISSLVFLYVNIEWL